MYSMGWQWKEKTTVPAIFPAGEGGGGQECHICRLSLQIQVTQTQRLRGSMPPANAYLDFVTKNIVPVFIAHEDSPVPPWRLCGAARRRHPPVPAMPKADYNKFYRVLKSVRNT